MTRRTVLLETQHDIADFVSKLEKCPFRADLHCGALVVDAKSLLGVMGFGLGRVSTLCVYSDDEAWLPEISKYVVRQ